MYSYISKYFHKVQCVVEEVHQVPHVLLGGEVVIVLHKVYVFHHCDKTSVLIIYIHCK